MEDARGEGFLKEGLYLVPPWRWAAFEVHRHLKMTFEVVFSEAFERLHPSNQDNQWTAITFPGRLLDTLQICNKLIRWCVEGAPEISKVFDAQTIANGKEEEGPANQLSIEAGPAGDDAYARGVVCKLVQQHAEHIAEFRNLVAHDVLSITQNECSSVLVSIHSLLTSVREDMRIEHEYVEENSVKRSIESTHDAKINAQHHVLSLSGCEAKLFVTMEILAALEETVVQLFQSMSEKLSVDVRCVSSLCALLRNEASHSNIAEAVGVDPKPLTLKKFIYVDGTLKDLRVTTTPKMKRVKTYSDLDIVFMARNLFNHSSFTELSEDVVNQWLTSSLIMINHFQSPERNFSDAVSELTLLQKLFLSPDKAVTVTINAQRKERRAEAGKVEALLPPAKLRPTAAKAVVRLMKKSASRAFVGREDILARLTQVATTIAPDSRVLVLSGHPGIGKSYIALKAAQSPAIVGLFQMQFWITATTIELLVSGLVGLINASDIMLAYNKMPLEKIISLTLEVCRQYSCYLVFDDVTQATAKAVQKIVNSFDVQSVAVVTTCIKGLELSYTAEELDVEALSMSDSFKLLEMIIRGTFLPQAMTAASHKARDKLWDDVMGNALAVEKIVETALGRSPLGVNLLGQLFANEMNFERVVAMFETLTEFSTVTSNNKLVYAQRHSGLETTVLYLLNPIREDNRLLSLLYAMSLMSPNGIPLRLLTSFEGEHLEPREFIAKELSTLESVGLVHTTTTVVNNASMSSSSADCSEVVYIMIHQLTQRALRKILPTDFGVSSSDVCRGVVRGFSMDLRLNEYAGVRLGRFLVNAEEALKWAECILFSLLPAQCIRSQDDENTDSSSLATGELVDGLLLACPLLVDLYPNHIKNIYHQLASIGSEDAVESPNILEDIIFKVQDDSVAIDRSKELDQPSIQKVLTLCVKQKVTLELICCFISKVLVAIGKARVIVPLDASFQTFRNNFNPAYVNASVELLRTHVAWVLSSWEGRPDEALTLLQGFEKDLKPTAKYYDSARLNCRYFTADAHYFSGEYDKALAVAKPLVEEYLARGNLMSWSNSSSMTANILMTMGRPKDALPILKRDFQHLRSLFGEGMNLQTVSTAHARLGRCYCRLDDFAGAEKHFLAFETLRYKLGNNDDVHEMWQLCWLYWKWGKYSIAWEWAKRRWAVIGGTQLGLFAHVIAHVRVFEYAYALGPKRGQLELIKLGTLNDPTLRADAWSFKKQSFWAATAFLYCSRACSYAGQYSQAWNDISAAYNVRIHMATDGKVLPDLIIWALSLHLLTAATDVISGNIPLESFYCNTVEKHETLYNATFESVGTTQDKKEAVHGLLKTAWKDCIRLAEKEGLVIADKSWHYGYANLLLQVKGSDKLQGMLRPSDETNETSKDMECPLLAAQPSALMEEARRVLQTIVAADVEVTEWTEMSRDLLKTMDKASGKWDYELVCQSP